MEEYIVFAADYCNALMLFMKYKWLHDGDDKENV